MTIAAIATLAASGLLPTLADAALADAHHAVLFAIDPAWMGEEPHLRHDVDACGLGEDALVTLEGAVWGEIAERDARRTDRRLATLADLAAAARPLPLAA